MFGNKKRKLVSCYAGTLGAHRLRSLRSVSPEDDSRRRPAADALGDPRRVTGTYTCAELAVVVADSGR